jgi:hypothetical protein
VVVAMTASMLVVFVLRVVVQQKATVTPGLFESRLSLIFLARLSFHRSPSQELVHLGLQELQARGSVDNVTAVVIFFSS